MSDEVAGTIVFAILLSASVFPVFAIIAGLAFGLYLGGRE